MKYNGYNEVKLIIKNKKPNILSTMGFSSILGEDNGNGCILFEKTKNHFFS